MTEVLNETFSEVLKTDSSRILSDMQNVKFLKNLS